MSAAGVDHARTLDTLRQFAGAEVPPPEGHVPFGDAGKAALTAAMALADERGDRHIGAEHIVLAVMDTDGELPVRILQDLGVDVAVLRERLGSPPV